MKTLVKTILKSFQKELRAVDSPTRSFSRSVELLKTVIAPATIIDIGVADGTPDLYAHFPQHSYLLIEANPAYKTALSQLQTELNAIVEPVFCGAKSGETQFNVFADPRKSSAFEVTRNLALEKQITVPIEPLDALVQKHHLADPFLLKIDVEGAEIDVLRGATETLKQTEAVIAEASILPKYKGGPEFADLVAVMKDAGFSVFDMAAGVNAGNGRLYQVDLIFVKTTAPFRSL